MHRISGLSCCALFLLSVTQSLQAATVFRCEDSSGHITFTLQGCPTDQLLNVQSAENLTPGSGQPVTIAPTGKRIAVKAGKSRPTKELTVVAEQHDGCGNRVTGAPRRAAIIRQQVLAGMTQADVESALGKPDTQSTINGETQYLYTADNGTRRKVSFDQSGCVKNKR